ncbi:FAD-dependent oxidoreductase [Paracoccus yeei]|nr:FAD-dependent oxidoreductase [Paracoccus yeei]
MKVLVVGAGIAGLSAAIALQQKGMRCTVIDRGIAPLGANIGLHSQVLRAIDSLGILDAAIAAGVTSDILPFAATLDEAGTFWKYQTRHPAELSHLPPSLSISRPKLTRLMMDRAEALGAVIADGISLTALEQTDEDVTVELSNGEARHYDFVVGADGVNSAVRTQLFGETYMPQDPELAIIRWMFHCREAITPGLWHSSKGDGITVVPTSDNTTYIASTFDSPPGHLASDADGIAALRDSFSHYDTETFRVLERHLDDDASVIVRNFKTVMVDRPWHVGRVVLIGDAAHTVLSHLAYGGALAVEDAVVLADELSQNRPLDASLSAFFDRRWPRVKAVGDFCQQIATRQKQWAPAQELIAIRHAAVDVVYQGY